METTHSQPGGWKQKLKHELRELLGIFLYLATFFLVFKLYTRLVLSEYQINYFDYGLTLLKALALAKVILTADALHLGDKFRGRPLIVPTLYNTVVFAAFALAFEIVEHVIMGQANDRRD